MLSSHGQESQKIDRTPYTNVVKHSESHYSDPRRLPPWTEHHWENSPPIQPNGPVATTAHKTETKQHRSYTANKICFTQSETAGIHHIKQNCTPLRKKSQARFPLVCNRGGILVPKKYSPKLYRQWYNLRKPPWSSVIEKVFPKQCNVPPVCSPTFSTFLPALLCSSQLFSDITAYSLRRSDRVWR